jgi:hypothetical protein
VIPATQRGRLAVEARFPGAVTCCLTPSRPGNRSSERNGRACRRWVEPAGARLVRTLRRSLPSADERRLFIAVQTIIDLHLT